MQIIMPNGYLTYVLAVLAIAGAGAGYYLGWIDGATALQTIFAGLSVFGIRKAITNQTTGSGPSHW